MVEKIPVILMKGIKRSESEALIKKLEENGAKLTLK